MTKDNTPIEIDTYEDEAHLRNICIHLGKDSTGTIQELRKRINSFIATIPEELYQQIAHKSYEDFLNNNSYNL